MQQVFIFETGDWFIGERAALDYVAECMADGTTFGEHRLVEFPDAHTPEVIEGLLLARGWIPRW